MSTFRAGATVRGGPQGSLELSFLHMVPHHAQSGGWGMVSFKYYHQNHLSGLCVSSSAGVPQCLRFGVPRLTSSLLQAQQKGTVHSFTCMFRAQLDGYWLELGSHASPRTNRVAEEMQRSDWPVLVHMTIPADSK